MACDIYFCGSIRGGRQDAELYGRLIKLLGEYGNVLTEHVGKEENDKETNDNEIHDKAMKLMDQAEVVVAEVTQPSLGVGYELGRAVTMGKRILCLYRKDASAGKKLSAMIRGLHNEDDIIVQDYKEEEAAEILREFFAMEDGVEDGEGDEDDDVDDEDNEGEEGEGDGDDDEDEDGE